jgi:2'-5' RNA ligase
VKDGNLPAEKPEAASCERIARLRFTIRGFTIRGFRLQAEEVPAMRLFIGVELEDRVKALAADVAERLRQRLNRRLPDFHARWIEPANLHVTLWFIGEVPDESLDRIIAALQAPAFSSPAFPLSLGGCGAFPPSGQPRVLWIGVHRGLEEMRGLYREVGARLEPLGYLPERRDYAAHLTIARVKDGGRGGAREIRSILAALPADCGVCQIAAVTLFRSRLSPRGATYDPLLRVPLS